MQNWGNAVGVGVGVDGWYVKVQVTSGVPPILQLKAPGGMCMTLRPGTAGEVLKWKTMLTLLKFVKLSAGVPLTMKSVGWILLGSVGSLKATEKSTGGVLITLPQLGSVMITKQTDGVGVGLGGTVAVAVAVGVDVGVKVAVAVAVAVEVGVAVAVAVAVGVDVAVGVGLAVGVGVGVPVGSLKA